MTTNKPNMNKVRAVLYLRVSSADQVNNFSLETQEEICRNVAEKLGYEVDRVFREEGVSAKNADRPQLIELLEYCRHNKNKITSVLVYKFDRLARNTSDHLAIRAKLAEYGIRLESASEPVEDSATGKFVETMFAAIAELDNSVRSERIRNGLQKRFFSGFTSKPPLGYKLEVIDNRKIPVPDKDFETLQKIWLLMATGTKGLSEIARIMNDKGLRVKWGLKRKLVTRQTTSKIFKNRFYCGYLTSRKHPDWTAKGVHTPMVTEETFNRVRAIILGKTQLSLSVKRRVHNPEFPLRGLVKCSICGGNMVAGNARGRSKTYAKYWCLKGCLPTIPADDLHALVKQTLGKITYSQGLIDLFNFRLKVLYEKRKAKILKQRSVAEKEILENKRMMSLLIENHLKGLYSDDIFKEQKARLEDRLLSSQVVVSDSTLEKYDIEAITNFLGALMRDLAKAYEVSDYSQKRVLIGSIYPSGLLYNGRTLLNRNISPSFRLIRDFCEASVLPSAGERI